MDVSARWLAGVSLVFGAFCAHAALIPVDGGKLVDNTDTNTMWVADGNLFKTLADASGNPSAFVQTVISASNGVIHDTPNSFDTPANSGNYDLTSYDLFPENGYMTWWGAQAFVNYLNSVDYAGYADWRLPTTVDEYGGGLAAIGVATGDYAPASGELAQLFYTELDGRPSNTPPLYFLGTLNADAVLFQNLQPDYHYGTEALAGAPNGDPSRAWMWTGGYEVARPKRSNKSVIATLPVRTGQAPLKELIASVQGLVKSGGAPLSTALLNLHYVCVALTQFENDPSTGGAVPDPLLKADIEAMAAVIGCT